MILKVNNIDDITFKTNVRNEENKILCNIIEKVQNSLLNVYIFSWDLLFFTLLGVFLSVLFHICLPDVGLRIPIIMCSFCLLINLVCIYFIVVIKKLRNLCNTNALSDYTFINSNSKTREVYNLMQFLYGKDSVVFKEIRDDRFYLCDVSNDSDCYSLPVDSINITSDTLEESSITVTCDSIDVNIKLK